MKYHFIGIKGSGMSALAQILSDLGLYVQGSDVDHHLYSEDLLRSKNIPIYSFDSNNVNIGLTIIVGNAFDESNVELKKAKELNLNIYKYTEMLGELVKKYKTLSICGTHGKTTTTSMISYIMNNTIGVNYLIGDGTGFANKNNEIFIMEACEFKRNFLHYYPKDIILTNIDMDHLDYFKDLDDIKDAFKEFIGHAENTLIACGDDLNVRSIINREVIYYGFNSNNDVVIENMILDETGSSFDLYYNRDYLDTFKINLYGSHMVLNAAAAIIYCYINDIPIEDIKRYINEFKGAKRRFKETIVNNTILIDDYAHHPTEIKTAILSAKQKYPNKKIVSVFFENTFSRTQKLYKEYANSLKLSDIVFVTDILSDREKKEDYNGVGPQLILDLLKEGYYLNIDNFLDNNNLNIVKPLLNYKNDVIIFMGCKEVYYLKDKLEVLLKEEI
ncbi:MAG: UDP-N-acetylmuramate--L-alanine ligase [Bacilli bacterium]|nr:UDP-N-acetylmuramate--L-alanine ligase [Bacilli bacterium]